MLTIEQLGAKRLAVIDKMKAINAACEAETREYTDEEVGQVQTLTQESDDLKAQIAKRELAETVGGTIAEFEAPPHRRSPQPAVPWTSDETKVTHVSVGEPNVLDDPRKGFKTPRHFLQTVMDVANGAKAPENLRILATIGSDEQGAYSDPYGGFLVPESFTPNMLRIEPEGDPMAGRTTMVPMATPSITWPVRVDKNHTSSVSGGLTVSRRAETAAASSSRMQLEKLNLNAASLFGLAYATEEILADSAISFISMLAQGFSDEFTSHMIDERLNGTGVGEHMGINNSGALITVNKETGQAADTILETNIIKMRARCWGYDKAIWLANHDCLLQLMQMNAEVGVGGTRVWQPSAREDHPDILFGRPLFFTEYTNTVGDAGDIILANWSQYLEGILQPLQSAESIHVRFVNHERAFKFWLRNAGAPWWNAALTPKKSSTTLSPFIRLQART